MENERSLEEYESILASIDESSSDDNSDEEYISTDNIEDIRYGSHVHPNINSRDTILKIHDHIIQAKSEWKGSELSWKMTVKILHEVFNAVVNELNN